MTFKTVELPATIFMVFHNDCAYYQGVLTEITDVNEEEDSCTMIIEDLAPTPIKCKVIYSKLDSDEIHYEDTGIHLFLTEKAVNQWFHEHPEILAEYDD